MSSRSAADRATPADRRRRTALAAVAALAIALLSTLAPDLLGGRVQLVQPLVHATAEAVGSVAAILTALLLLQREREEALHSAPAAVGLLGMGIFGCLHAATAPGNGFVLLHCAATLAGALGFTLAWVPRAALHSAAFWTRRLPAAVVVASLVFGLMVWTERGAFPAMVRGGGFTPEAIGINLAAGALFLAACARFLADYLRRGRSESFVFGCMALLLGLSGVMFQASEPWDGVWWSWHAVRLGAYVIGFWLIDEQHRRRVADLGSALQEQRRAEAELRNANAELDERVRQRTADLERAAVRMGSLQSVTAALSQALTSTDVLDVIVRQGVAAFGARSGAVCRLVDDGAAFEIVASVGYPCELMASWRRFSPEAAEPVADAVRAGRPLFFESLADHAERYPDLAALGEEPGALAAVPLMTQGEHVVGGMCLRLPERHRFTEGDRAMLLALARQGAQALERARLYESEREARRLAEHATQARENLLAVVSHDLRNPLTAIKLAAARLPRLIPSGDRERIAAAVGSIDRAAARMEVLIADLLDAAKIEAGGLSVDRQRHDAVSMIREAAEALQPVAEQKSMHIELEIADDLPAMRCDRGRILQLLSNLLGNAVKFTPERGLVRVRAELRGRDIVVAVGDTGPGIPEELLPHVFDRYWQADRAHRAGAGLGLYIAKGIVEAHGGRIWVETTVGVGSTFAFTIPAAVEAAGDAVVPISRSA